jgi:Arc/MetJ-type ribon-helix-helix transcriptional regulator
MLRIINLEEIQGLLLRVPQLVDLLERRTPSAVSEVKSWLTTVEQTLVNNRMPLAGNIATLRGILISAERGVIPTGVVFHGRPTVRKIREATTADVLRQSSDLVADAVREDTARIAEAERLGHQIVVIAKSQGLVPQEFSGGDRNEMLENLWSSFSTDANIKAGAVRLLSLVGQNDVLIILDRAIEVKTRRETTPTS